MNDPYAGQKRYYDLRAPEYDATAWRPVDERERAEIDALIAAIEGLPPATTLDVACGTGFLSAHLPGTLTLLDASESMLRIAARRLPGSAWVQADAMALPFPDRSFERVFSSQFYDHLVAADRPAFLAEALRVAPELVLVVQTRGPEHRELTERRRLRDGTEHAVHQAYFSPRSLLAELGPAQLLLAGESYLVVSRRRSPRPRRETARPTAGAA